MRLKAALQNKVTRALFNPERRAITEANQQEMFSYGLWGVPSFRVGPVATWDQDRLWVIEGELKRIAAGEEEARASHK